MKLIEVIVVILLVIFILFAVLWLTGCTAYQEDGYTAVSVGWRVDELAEFCRSIR